MTDANLSALDHAIAQTARALASAWTVRDRAYLCAIDAVWRNERAALLKGPQYRYFEHPTGFIVDPKTGEHVPLLNALVTP